MEHQEAALINSKEGDQISEKHQQLSSAIEQQWQDLLRGIQIQVRRCNIAHDNNSIESLAEEFLHDAIVKAFTKIEQYDPNQPVRPWLWVIAINEMRMRTRRMRKVEDKYITLVGDENHVRKISSVPGNTLSEEEMFDILYTSQSNPQFDAGLTIDDLLSLVNESDREILELVFVYGFRGQSLAEKIGISVATAYMRQSRAVARLREAYLASEYVTGKEK